MNAASERQASAPGAANGTVGTPTPSDTTASARNASSSGTPATANPVAVGGWAWMTAFTSLRF